jgi:hypothetical protein
VSDHPGDEPESPSPGQPAPPRGNSAGDGANGCLLYLLVVVAALVAWWKWPNLRPRTWWQWTEAACNFFVLLPLLLWTLRKIKE